MFKIDILTGEENKKFSHNFNQFFQIQGAGGGSDDEGN